MQRHILYLTPFRSSSEQVPLFILLKLYNFVWWWWVKDWLLLYNNSWEKLQVWQQRCHRFLPNNVVKKLLLYWYSLFRGTDWRKQYNYSIYFITITIFRTPWLFLKSERIGNSPPSPPKKDSYNSLKKKQDPPNLLDMRYHLGFSTLKRLANVGVLMDDYQI